MLDSFLHVKGALHPPVRLRHPHTFRRVIRHSCSPSAEVANALRQHFLLEIKQKGWHSFPPKDPHFLVSEAWQALDTIYGVAFETRLEPSPWLAQQSDKTSVLLKLELQQATGSFKARGAAHKILSLSPEQLAGGLFTSSTGNHALAVLHACKAVGERKNCVVRPHIYLPRTANRSKVERLQEAGAEVVFHGDDCLEAEREARRAAAAQGGVYISPYNDVQVAGGQGTLALELLKQLSPDHLDMVFVPVGGGGLISGIASVLKAASPSIHTVGCQPAASDVMRRSAEQGKVVEVPWRDTLSDGTAGGIEEDTITLEPCMRFVDEWVTVQEDDIARAMLHTYTHHGYAVEGAAGVAIAAYLQKAAELTGRNCVIVCCGGNVAKETMDKAYRLIG